MTMIIGCTVTVEWLPSDTLGGVAGLTIGALSYATPMTTGRKTLPKSDQIMAK